MTLGSFATKAQLSDTVYTHEGITASLIFPGDISLADIGSSDFLFEYEGNLLIIKALRPSEGLTSLLVRYGDNRYFTGSLGYDTSPGVFSYDYREKEKSSPSASKAAAKKESISLGKSSQNLVSQTKARQQLSKLLKLRAGHYAGASKQKHGLSAELEVIRNSSELTLLRIKLTNHSSLPFKLGFTGLHIEEEAAKKGLAAMVRDIKPVTSQIPEVIMPNKSAFFAFGYTHFATSKKAKLVFRIRERQGSRSVELSIPSRYVLHAKPL